MKNRLLLAALAAALLGRWARACETEVSLTRGADKAYEVSGLFTVSASTDVVWGVLTDYEEIPSFVSSMRSSRVQETRPDGTSLVAQKAVGDMFFLSKTMRILLEVRRTPEVLRFVDVGHEDFRSYEGNWEARPTAEGSGVAYHLRAQPGFAAPSFFLVCVLCFGVCLLIDQVRAEIVRRELAR